MILSPKKETEKLCSYCLMSLITSCENYSMLIPIFLKILFFWKEFCATFPNKIWKKHNATLFYEQYLSTNK